MWWQGIARVLTPLACCVPTTGVLVETLLARGTARDQVDAERAVDRLALVPADNGWVIRDLMRRAARQARPDSVAAARAVGPNAWCDGTLPRSRRAIPHDGHIAGLRRALGMGRGDEMILCRALTASTVPLDALETVWLTTPQGGPLWASSSG